MWGADRFVDGASAAARYWGVSPLVIGLTVVGIGTSAPELLVSGVAAWKGMGDMSIGNAVGSNITNVALVLGATSLVAPVSFRPRLLVREMPVLFVVMGFGFFLMADGVLGRVDGFLLLGGFVLVLLWICWMGSRERGTHYETAAFKDTWAPMLVGLGGLVVLLISARVVVTSASLFALQLGVSELMVGLSVVALGTSLPELAASLTSALKGQDDIAVGNVIGSNLFNLLGVLGLPGAIHPGSVEPQVLSRHFPIMVGTAGLLYLLVGWRRNRQALGRPSGAILVTTYFAWLFVLATGY